MVLCKCGCGQEAKQGNRFIDGHNRRNAGYHERHIPKLCECGCGEYVKPGNRFIVRHSNRGTSLSPEHITKLRKPKANPRRCVCKDVSKPHLCECGCGEHANHGQRFIKGHEHRGKTYWKKQEPQKLCACGCGEYANTGNMFINGHNKRVPKSAPRLCKCGCGGYATLNNQFIRGHQNIGRTATDETRKKMSDMRKGRTTSDACKAAISKAKKGRAPTRQHRKKISATLQGIPYEEWDGFVDSGRYCEKFDDACKERIREKYNRICYVCGKDEKDNNKKLSVHHVDMDKNQGCDGKRWNLIPLCQSCHGKSHSNPLKSRLVYLSMHTQTIYT